MKNETDDYYLVKRILKGETECFAKLVEKYEDRVYKTCFRFVRNPEDALDLSQETFMKVYDSLSDFRGSSTLSTWIYRICVNTCLNFLRKRNLLVIDIESCEPSNPSSDGPEKQVELKELFDLLDLNLKKSGKKTRKIFLYRLLYSMPFKEIACKLGISTGSARMKYSRARKSLRESITQYQKGE